MGIFGRDDKSTPQETIPAPQASAPRAPAKVQANTSGTTIIARPTRIEGTLSGSGDVTVEGEFKGTVNGTGNLFVAEAGKVEAKLHARTVIVAGAVAGDVSADEKIELRPTGQLRGNMVAPRILIQEGAVFEGQVQMRQPDKAAPQPTPPSEPAKSSTDATGGPPKDPSEKDKDDKGGRNLKH